MTFDRRTPGACPYLFDKPPVAGIRYDHTIRVWVHTTTGLPVIITNDAR